MFFSEKSEKKSFFKREISNLDGFAQEEHMGSVK